MVLDYDFDQPQVSTKGDLDYVTINGLDRYFKPGTPVIPAKPVEILVPAGMKIANITSIAIDTYQLPGTYSLSHGQNKQRRPVYGEKIEPATPTPPEPEIFSMTTFWPAKQHDMVTVQTNRGYNIAHVILFPLQYAPKDGKIKMATRMQLTVCFTETDSPRCAKPTKNLMKKLKRKLDNPDTIGTYDAGSAPPKGPDDPLSDPEGPYYGENWKYVVITNSTLAGVTGQYSFQGAYNLEAARRIKPVCGDARLLLVGGLRHVAQMEEIAAAGHADFISMSRPFIREPSLVRRIREGKADAAACASCNRCLAATINNMPVRCYYNGFPNPRRS